MPIFYTIRPPQGIACRYQHIQQGAYFSVHKGALITCSMYGSMIENNQVEQMNLLLYVNPYYHSMI